jgi:hypothetical protein
MPYNFGDYGSRAREGKCSHGSAGYSRDEVHSCIPRHIQSTVAHIEYGIFDVRQTARGYNSRPAPASCSYRAVEATARISSKSQIVRPDDRAAEADMGVI